VRKKIFVVLVLFLALTAYSQDSLKVNVIKVEMKSYDASEEIQDEYASIQATKKEKQRTAALGGFPLGVKDEAYVVSTGAYCIKLTDVDSFEWLCELFVLLSSDVRFLVIWNGPGGMGTYLSDWFEVDKNKCVLFVVTSDKEGFEKGVHTVTFIFETKTDGSASGNEISYSVRLH